MAPSSTENDPFQGDHVISSEVVKTETDVWRLETIPGKGKGLIASEDIVSGTLILSDFPLLKTDVITSMETVERDLARALKALPKTHQRAFLSLHNNYPGKNPLSNIIRSNGYPLGPGSEVGGVFPNLSRINHSCKPNAKHSWNPALQKYVVYAIRSITKGQEILVSYLSGGDSQQRQRELKDNFGFTCACELCSLPALALRASDSRLIRADALNRTIGDSQSVRNSPAKVLKNCVRLRDIYLAEGVVDDRLPNLYYDCFQINNIHGDQARASVFARKYCEEKRVAEGPDSVNALEMMPFVEDPSKDDSFGSTQGWKSSVKDIPVGLDSGKFEKWLWREDA
ncbi:SET domain-containing 5 [Hyphodiscus hymeniophilus]|uniref:SET domain-containing 5 n=1 Tax=Hyphodiscus hymeniophilus TaxID=353542 RepID=A0A9P6VGG6_9HELO|nr:SET domain-containing 5 [Hyphodiscus hymeniophilus]